MTAARERRTILVLAAAGFVSAAAIRVCDPMLPALALEFATTTGHAAEAVTAYAVAYAVFQFFFGPAGDHYGKLKVIAAATLACALGSAGAATASALGWLVGWRALSGATGAGIIALALAWIGDAVPYERRQATLARFMTGSILGMAAGQLIGGTFTDIIGWRGAFAFLAASYVVVGSLLLLELRRMESTRHAANASAPRSDSLRFVQQTRAVLSVGWARTILALVCVEAMYLAQSTGIALAAAVVDRAGAIWLYAGAAIALPLLGAGFARLIRDRPAPALRPDASSS